MNTHKEYTTSSPESKGMEEWEEEFDRLSDWDNFPKGEYHELLGEHLFKSAWYPEQQYEIDPNKIKDFIKTLLLSTRQEANQRVAEAVRGERERVLEIIEVHKKHPIDFGLDNYEHQEADQVLGYNQALATLSDKIK